MKNKEKLLGILKNNLKAMESISEQLREVKTSIEEMQKALNVEEDTSENSGENNEDPFAFSPEDLTPGAFVSLIDDDGSVYMSGTVMFYNSNKDILSLHNCHDQDNYYLEDLLFYNVKKNGLLIQ